MTPMSTQENQAVNQANPLPNFFAIIPAHVRYCKELEPNAKLLYGELTALANQHGYCWANNDYFAGLYDVTDRSIQNWLQSLKENGFIKIGYEDEKTRNGRRIYISKEIQEFHGVGKILHTPPKNSSAPPAKNFVHNITKNTTYEKEQQQQDIALPAAAAVFSEKKDLAKQQLDCQSQHSPILSDVKIFPCLYEVELTQDTRVYVTRNATEIVAKDAVEALKQHIQNNTLKTTPDQFMKWAIKKEIKPKPSMEDLSAENEQLAKSLYEKFPTHDIGYIEILSKKVEIGYKTGQIPPVEILYTDPDFKAKLKKAYERFILGVES